MRTRAQRIARLFFFVLPVFLVFAAVMIWVVMSLWNWLMPSIFSIRAVTYWQTLGLVVLSWILFRGFRGPRFSRGHWGHRMRERWRNMTPEQREEFAQGMRSRWRDWRERWGSMTPEDREEFVKGGRSQWHELRELWGRMSQEERDALMQEAKRKQGARSEEQGGGS